MLRSAIVLSAVAAVASAGTVIVLRAQDERAPREDPVKVLSKARLDLARQGLQATEKQTATGTRPDPQATWIWADRVLRAELTLSTKPEERIAVLQTYVQRARAMERAVRVGVKEKLFTLPEMLDAEYNRLGAELQLAQEEAQQKARQRH
jgi:hypothetical protein